MLIAHILTPILRLLPIPQQRPLPPQRMQPPLLPIEPDPIRARQAILAPNVILSAQLVAELVLYIDAVEFEDGVPGAAETVEVDALGAGEVGSGMRREAGDFGILRGEAEVREDVGGILVPVVVLDLDVMGFAVLFPGGCGKAAEAVRVE